MTEAEIKLNNLIDKFYYGEEKGQYYIGLNDYSKHWELIMPVWIKIISLKLKETEDMCIREPWGKLQPIRNALSDGEILTVWQTIVGFIKWYNKEQQSKGASQQKIKQGTNACKQKENPRCTTG